MRQAIAAFYCGFLFEWARFRSLSQEAVRSQAAHQNAPLQCERRRSGICRSAATGVPTSFLGLGVHGAVRSFPCALVTVTLALLLGCRGEGGQLGEPCNEIHDCESRLCFVPSGSSGMCTKECESDCDCLPNLRCAMSEGGPRVCVPGVPECSSTLDGGEADGGGNADDGGLDAGEHDAGGPPADAGLGATDAAALLDAGSSMLDAGADASSDASAALDAGEGRTDASVPRDSSLEDARVSDAALDAAAG